MVTCHCSLISLEITYPVFGDLPNNKILGAVALAKQKVSVKVRLVVKQASRLMVKQALNA